MKENREEAEKLARLALRDVFCLDNLVMMTVRGDMTVALALVKSI